ncbi:MAG: GAF domain-containing protein [Alphaproteobacteria bacterium]|nr:GAF domain-containing protein [Alphaproteobacteria bacterium]
MAVATQIVDIDVNPLEERRRRRRAWMRIGVPVVSVALMIAAILGIALYAERANRAGILSLSDEVLATLEARVTLQISSYLTPAARALRIVGEMIEAAGRNPNRLIERYATGVLREIPQIAIVSLADEDGNYMMVTRGDANTIETTTIRETPGPRQVTVVRRGTDGAEIDTHDDPSNLYDPRTRPWYKGAASFGEALYWTDPYIFAGSQRPGITVSTRHRAPDGRDYVVGLDLTLDTLSAFLATLEIGRSGRAIIMDDSGLLVATPRGADALVREVDGKPVNLHIDQLDDPVLVRAYDAFRIEGAGRRTIEIDGKPYITVATPLPDVASNWLILMVVPEADFTGFVSASSRNALAMSLVLVAIAGTLGALLVRQGLRADRTARMLADRQHTLQRHSAAFASLAADAELFDPRQDKPPRSLTETLAQVTSARRASVWRLVGGRTLHCEDSFDRDSGGHVADMELHHAELPQFFAQLAEGEPFEIADAAADRRTAELHRVVLAPLGSRALLSVPIKRGDQVLGAIWLEDAPSRAANRDFLAAVANMVAPRMAEAPDPVAFTARDRTVATAAPAPATRSFEAELLRRGIDTSALNADVYPDVAAMALLFTDPEALAARVGSSEHSVSDEIVRALQEIAATYDIPYLKIVGQEVVAAIGFAKTPGSAAADAVAALADAAVAMRERCIALYEDMDRPQDVRIGIDCGMAIGCAVGAEPRVFNLWGEAVRGAHMMAASALPGTVQITQAAYQRLSQEFLFRPRGRFYIPRVGEARTFVLAGRL